MARSSGCSALVVTLSPILLREDSSVVKSRFKDIAVEESFVLLPSTRKKPEPLTIPSCRSIPAPPEISAVVSLQLRLRPSVQIGVATASRDRQQAKTFELQRHAPQPNGEFLKLPQRR